MILITGATGQIGRTPVATLKSRGAGIRAVTRTAGAAPLPAGLETVVADLTRPESFAAALILGRPARTFAQWVGDHADALQPEAS